MCSLHLKQEREWGVCLQFGFEHASSQVGDFSSLGMGEWEVLQCPHIHVAYKGVGALQRGHVNFPSGTRAYKKK